MNKTKQSLGYWVFEFIYQTILVIITISCILFIGFSIYWLFTNGISGIWDGIKLITNLLWNGTK